MTGLHHRNATRIPGRGMARILTPVLVLVGVASQLALDCSAQPDSYREQRAEMVRQAVQGAGVKDLRVLAAMRQTRRHEFVAPRYRPQAYFDMALPIGSRQTISSPFIVSYMTEVLQPQPTDRVLEIGTGSGYQAAVLSPLVESVYTIEIVPSLGKQADRTLTRLGYTNVHTRVGDGFQGWPEEAPFDKIIVTCSPEKVPLPLKQQLKEGGRLVVPVGERYQQTLYVLTKKNGELVSEALRPTLFVPMTGRAEDNRIVQPDPANPTAVNGDLEEAGKSARFFPGWYYQRQALRIESPEAPQGRAFARFQNETAGRSSHMLQGLGIDGSRVGRVELSGSFRCRNVAPGKSSGEVAMLAISFYDGERRDLGMGLVGPIRGNHDWRTNSRTIRVPFEAREAILRVGLFGATGRMDVDDIRLVPQPR